MRLFEKRWMVKVKSFLRKNYFRDIRNLVFVLIFLLMTPVLQSQNDQDTRTEKKKIELIYADEDQIVKDPITGNDIHRFKGDVHLRHNDITMWCDSAHFKPDRNEVQAFQRIHIEQGDTLNLFGDYLFYDGRNETAFVKGNVELIDKETHLYTDSIHYDVRNRIARYTRRGRITNAENTLTSIIGVYYVADNLFHFKDSVKIVNPDYVMTADTMDYNTQSETSYFAGPTELRGDSIYLYCERGWYDTRNDITSIWKKAMIDNMKQIVHGDSIYFDNNTGYGESFRNVTIEDTTNSMIVKGDYAWYIKQPEQFLVTKKAMFIQFSKSDSLFLHSDTIRAITISDTAKEYRVVKSYHNCRIFSQNVQAKCDSLSYSFRDSVIRLYKSPVIWSDENQLTSDSMAIITKNREADRLELYNSAFVTSQVDTFRFNQIKGRDLTGYFKNNELYKIDIKGNGEAVYYLLDNDLLAGRNQTKCANISILIEKNKITDIYEYGNPEGIIDPPVIDRPDTLRLPGFIWLNNFRPKKKSDIFIK